MGSALLNTETADSTFAAAESPAATGAPTAAALRAQVAERLAAHRSRRGHAQPRTAPAATPAQPASSRSARIAAAVAERYAHTQSYRAFLAAEAERAVQQARAAAEIAALNAQAVAATQQSLLDTLAAAEIGASSADTLPHETAVTSPAFNDDLTDQLHPKPEPHSPVEQNLWPDLDPQASHKRRSVILSEGRNATEVEGPAVPSHHHHHSHRSPSEPHPSDLEPRTSNPPFTVRLYEDASTAAHVTLAPRPPSIGHENRALVRNDAEACALDDEIAFRQSPVFEEPAGPPMPLPANLIEFPRQLVASRKARPRLAEGPLRDEAALAPGDSQLRIFEVEPEQVSTTPVADSNPTGPAAPQWTSIWLDAPGSAAQPSADASASHLAEMWTHGHPQPSAPAAISQPSPSCADAATIGRRLLAVAINAAIVLTGLAAFAAVFAVVAGHLLPWQPDPSLHMRMGRVAVQTGLQLSQLPAAAAITAAALFLLYQALFFSFSTATPGMRCARIALCTFDDENPTRSVLRRRILALLLSAGPLGLGFLWAALDEDRLAWHDRLTRTYQRRY